MLAALSHMRAAKLQTDHGLDDLELAILLRRSLIVKDSNS